MPVLGFSIGAVNQFPRAELPGARWMYGGAAQPGLFEKGRAVQGNRGPVTGSAGPDLAARGGGWVRSAACAHPAPRRVGRALTWRPAGADGSGLPHVPIRRPGAPDESTWRHVIACLLVLL